MASRRIQLTPRTTARLNNSSTGFDSGSQLTLKAKQVNFITLEASSFEHLSDVTLTRAALGQNTGLVMLDRQIVPEPAAVAAVLGLLALGFVVCQRAWRLATSSIPLAA